jgi:octaheme c-type cytochrome (tetrathionate reductase family)
MKARPFIRLLGLLLALGLLVAGRAWSLPQEKPPAPGTEYGTFRNKNVTADHAKFEALKKEFKTGPEVTAACLSCHTEAAAQVMQTLHWTWLDPADPDKKLGKRGLIVNNFCLTMPSNEPRCTSCHVGYGWKDKSFDFTDQTKVDCLVCHDQTRTYVKFPAGAGNPVAQPTVFPGDGKTYNPPDWNKVAQSVGRPTRFNCGVCHFYGGGGEGVKHGDLDASMLQPKRDLDVHMDHQGLNFDCTRCHTTVQHHVAGRSYKTAANQDRRSLIQDDLLAKNACESCHTLTPHRPGGKANDHTDKVACQTCHIPEFARGNSTKLRWDWSTAGKRQNGKPVKEMKDGRPSYDGQKGNFIWAKNVKPEYFWYNGEIRNLLLTDKIDPAKAPIALAYPVGQPGDGRSRIYPFKVHAGRQPYDSGNKTMLGVKLFGPKDSGAYWGDWDWTTALAKGMDYLGLPYSGKFDWVETTYVFPTTHQVAPVKSALACAECHAENGRLGQITGVYLPGRDHHRPLTIVGWGLVIAALLAVFSHAVGRIVARKKRD